MRIFGGDRIGNVMSRLGADEDTPIENRIISRSLEKAQERVEGYNFDQRKTVVQYDDVMNRHRKAVYSMRREILRATDISKRVKALIEEEVHLLAGSPELMSDNYEDTIKEIFPFDEPTLDRMFDTEADKFEPILLSEAKELYASRETAFGIDFMRRLERDIYLQILDDQWMQHLENMDHLREGIHWMGVGQQDPLVEYRRQGQVLFDAMLQTLRHLVIRTVFNTYPVDVGQLDRPIETSLTRAARGSVENAGQIIHNQDEFHEEDFIATAKNGSDSANQTTRQNGSGNLASSKKTIGANQRKKARKTERKRKTVAKRRKR
jgi:preprotein translocase subunit SecA